MKITFFPFMPCCDTGSSRVRAYWLARHLAEKGIDAQAAYHGAPPDNLDNVLDSDILVFQKTYSEP
ncbi:unnamed protein product, partial [marine sediment metagenome]